jgi:hypothetical protein
MSWRAEKPAGNGENANTVRWPIHLTIFGVPKNPLPVMKSENIVKWQFHLTIFRVPKSPLPAMKNKKIVKWKLIS